MSSIIAPTSENKNKHRDTTRNHHNNNIGNEQLESNKQSQQKSSHPGQCIGRHKLARTRGCRRARRSASERGYESNFDSLISGGTLGSGQANGGRNISGQRLERWRSPIAVEAGKGSLELIEFGLLGASGSTLESGRLAGRRRSFISVARNKATRACRPSLQARSGAAAALSELNKCVIINSSAIKVCQALGYAVVLLLLSLNLRWTPPSSSSSSTTTITPTTMVSANGDQAINARTLISAVVKPRRPDSSSSMFAEIEDLTDSSIKTRLGKVDGQDGLSKIEHLGDSPTEFNRLLDRLLATPHHNQIHYFGEQSGIGSKESPGQLQQPVQANLANVAADANNRTTMRFFRNNKTFASIVYTNELSPEHPTTNGKQLSAEQHRPQAEAPPPPKRLINCHLVDLERHSSDIALYESKYNIRTIDIEFREMMQLIEACTNIARLKRRPYDPHLHQFHHNPNSPASPSLMATPSANGGANRSQQSHLEQPLPSGATGQPVIVVNKPVPFAAPAGVSLQQHQHQTQLQPLASGSSIATFQDFMTGALKNELERLPPSAIVDDSDKLDLPAIQPMKPDHDLHYREHHKQRSKRQQRQHPPRHPNGNRNRLISKAIEKVGDTISKKLVLGEVTAPPEAINGSRNGGFREALQEITSYDTTDLLAIWRGILPGTNWCGMGDRATSYNDLGFESDIDICCRAHDFCPVRLAAFSSGYGLFNWSFYTRSHCWCDQNFLDCLKQAESPLSSVVMKFYFTIMKTTCLNDNDANVAVKRAGGSSSKLSGLVGSGAHQTLGAHGQLSRSFQQQQHNDRHYQQPPNGPLIPALKQSQMFQAKFDGRGQRHEQKHRHQESSQLNEHQQRRQQQHQATQKHGSVARANQRFGWL